MPFQGGLRKVVAILGNCLNVIFRILAEAFHLKYPQPFCPNLELVDRRLGRLSRFMRALPSHTGFLASNLSRLPKYDLGYRMMPTSGGNGLKSSDSQTFHQHTPPIAFFHPRVHAFLLDTV